MGNFGMSLWTSSTDVPATLPLCNLADRIYGKGLLNNSQEGGKNELLLD